MTFYQQKVKPARWQNVLQKENSGHYLTSWLWDDIFSGRIIKWHKCIQGNGSFFRMFLAGEVSPSLMRVSQNSSACLIWVSFLAENNQRAVPSERFRRILQFDATSSPFIPRSHLSTLTGCWCLSVSTHSRKLLRTEREECSSILSTVHFCPALREAGLHLVFHRCVWPAWLIMADFLYVSWSICNNKNRWLFYAHFIQAYPQLCMYFVLSCSNTTLNPQKRLYGMKRR